MKKTRFLVLILSVLIVVQGTMLLAGARYSYLQDHGEHFDISSGGVATVRGYCEGPSVVERVRIHYKIQKKGLLFWNTVSGGDITDSCYDNELSTEHGLLLSETGKYRAVIEYTLYTSNDDEDIEFILTANY